MEGRVIRFLCWYMLALGFGFSIWHAHPSDSTWWYTTTAIGVVEHPGGVVCAYIAALCYVIWGNVAILIPFFFLVIAGAVWADYNLNRSNFLAWRVFLFLIVLSIACQSYALYSPHARAGGSIGFYGYRWIVYFCGRSAAEIVIMISWAMLVTWLIGTTWVLTLIDFLARGIRRWIVPCFEYFWHALYGAYCYLRYQIMCTMRRKSFPEETSRDETPLVDVRAAERIKPKNRHIVHNLPTGYKKPALHTLFTAPEATAKSSSRLYEAQARILEEKLVHFGVRGKVTSITIGPVVVLFEYQPQSDVPVNKIIAREHDLALALQAISIRIIAPIPGKSVVGFECGKVTRDAVLFADHWQALLSQTQIRLPLLLGVTTVGLPVVLDLVAMPHMLVAGSTGAGKSVALNSMIISLLSTTTPDDMRLILIDPKRLEFAWYADLAHLLFPIVTDPRDAVMTLRWAVQEMERRYTLLATAGATNIASYREEGNKLADIVIVIDEWADLMMSGGKEAENSLVRLAQMARAAGIHVIVATQRPSVDVITGLIKVNIPVRVAFKVTSKIDSRTILDSSGAERLLGKGDMLLMMPGKPIERMHGVFCSHHEIQEVACAVRRQGGVAYADYRQSQTPAPDGIAPEDAELYHQVLDLVRSMDEISISLLQRRLRIGYNRSARMIDYLEAHGMILPSDGGKARRIVR